MKHRVLQRTRTRTWLVVSLVSSLALLLLTAVSWCLPDEALFLTALLWVIVATTFVVATLVAIGLVLVRGRSAAGPSIVCVTSMALWSVVPSVCPMPRHPTDADLIDRFRQEQASFERLREMFVADTTLGRVAPGFTRPATFAAGVELPSGPLVTPVRLQDYRDLFVTLGLDDGIEGYGTKEIVWFHASSLGLAVSGSAKGYAWYTRTPGLLVPNLDEDRKRRRGRYTAFRAIGGNWYLYYDVDP